MNEEGNCQEMEGSGMPNMLAEALGLNRLHLRGCCLVRSEGVVTDPVPFCTSLLLEMAGS